MALYWSFILLSQRTDLATSQALYRSYHHYFSRQLPFPTRLNANEYLKDKVARDGTWVGWYGGDIRETCSLYKILGGAIVLKGKLSSSWS